MKYKTLALNTQRVILSVQDIESNLKDRVIEMIIEREIAEAAKDILVQQFPQIEKHLK